MLKGNFCKVLMVSTLVMPCLSLPPLPHQPEGEQKFLGLGSLLLGGLLADATISGAWSSGGHHHHHKPHKHKPGHGGHHQGGYGLDQLFGSLGGWNYGCKRKC